MKLHVSAYNDHQAAPRRNTHVYILELVIKFYIATYTRQ